MCGIFGAIGYISRETAEKCTSILEHRGPDASGVWQDGPVTLGHRRLSIIDLSDQARQPMMYGNGRYWITFNGEIYNFIEIRKQLITEGRKFATDSDTEVILAAYERWGTNCLNKFNGMWSFAIWDCAKNELFLARDRFGKKPLFYSNTRNNVFAFASEMKALLPLIENPRPNLRVVTGVIPIFNYEATEECAVADIKRFPAAHYGFYKNGKLTCTRWWSTLDHLPIVPERFEEQAEQFRDLFFDACALRMRSDVPIGTALSGGLDSSATLLCMANLAKSNNVERQGRDWQHAFIASFPGTPLDEVRYALKVTERAQIRPTIIEVDPLEAIGKLNHYLYLFEDLYVTNPIPFMLTYGAVKKAGISVTLDGHGADEIFGGYNFDFLTALLDAGLHRKQIRSILETYFSSSESSQLLRQSPHGKFWIKWMGKELTRRLLLRNNESRSLGSAHPAWKKLDHLSRRLYVSTHETILPTLLRNYDRYSMANGVEIRMPFMDHRIVTFAFALPWTSKLRNGFSKAIIRYGLSDYMPEEIAFRRSKIGFNSPIVDWIKGPLKGYFLDLLASKSFSECGLVNHLAIRKIFKLVIDNPDASFLDGEKAWTLLMPFLWEQAVLKNHG